VKWSHPAGYDEASLVPYTQERGAETRITGAMQRQQFVLEASRILAASTDYEASLKSVARLAVPDIADWCVVDLVQDDGSPTRVAIEHRGCERQQLATELNDQYAPILEAGARPEIVLHTGRDDDPERVPQSFIEAAGVQPERLRLLRRLGLHAYICAPLIARGQVLGTITLFSGHGRAFGPEDLAMAEELARRSAMAVDNARLHAEAQRAIRSRDELLAMVGRLRTPLSTIVTAAEDLMASAPASEEGRRLLDGADACRRVAQHIGRLIGDLTNDPRLEGRAGPALERDGRLEADLHPEPHHATIENAGHFLVVGGGAAPAGDRPIVGRVEEIDHRAAL
jgi:GAF domain-containing protein